MDKSSTNLKEAYKNGQRDFQGYNLTDADLGWITLDGSDFRGTDFYGANLSGASLRNTNFSGKTNLAFANLSRADLKESDLRGTNLEGANLEGAILIDALYDETTRFPKGFNSSITGAVLIKNNNQNKRVFYREDKPDKEEFLDNNEIIISQNQKKIFREITSSTLAKTKIVAGDHIQSRVLPSEDITNTLEPLPTTSVSEPKKNNFNKFIIAVFSFLLLFFLFSLLSKPNHQSSTHLNTQTQPEVKNQDLTADEIRNQDLTADEAKKIIEYWLVSKSKIFAPPYDRELLSEITTGRLYQDIVEPGKGINWLIENNAYYQFGIQSIDSIQNFELLNSDIAKVTAIITESRSLYINGRYDSSKSEQQTSKMQFSLLRENGSWKISDYEDIQ
ncbi:MAG TPA: IMS domain-containing protein [Stenomitos sp.]